MKRILLIAAGVALAAFAAYRSVLFVDEAEFAVVTQFGRPVRTVREAGAHLILPIQSALRVDRRVQVYDPKPSEFLAKEKKNVDLDVFVTWRVAEPLRFLESAIDMIGAEARIHDIVWSVLAAEIGRNPREALVTTDTGEHKLDQIVSAVRGRCAERARKDLGVEILDVRLKRISLPSQVRDSVFKRMRDERARIAAQYRAEGEEQAMMIRSDADKQRTVTLADAYKEAEKTRGDAEAAATAVYAQAHAKDPGFFELRRTLEAYRKLLDEKTTIILSADSDLLKFLVRGPSALGPSTQPATPQAAPAPTAPGTSEGRR